MLVTPILWIWKSRKANWQGWGERKEKSEKFFYFVRKPDLFHDLMAEREERGKRNIKINGGFSYIRKDYHNVSGRKETDFQNKKDRRKIYIVKKGI